MKDGFFFDSMLRPKIIVFIYWLGLTEVSGPAWASCCSA